MVRFLEACPGLPKQFMEALGPRLYKIENLVEDNLTKSNQVCSQLREKVREIQVEFSRKRLAAATRAGYTDAQNITG